MSLDDKCSLSCKIRHTTLEVTLLEAMMSKLSSKYPLNHATPLLLTNSNIYQIYSVGRAAILSNNDVYFSHKMALAALWPFQMCIHCAVFDTNCNIMAHFHSKYDLTKSSYNLCGPYILHQQTATYHKFAGTHQLFVGICTN
jgi:hypothetical protein